MGQRSQFLAAISDDNGNTRVGRHYQWVWGNHLIARVAQLAKYLDANEGIPSRSLASDIHVVVGYNTRTQNVQGVDAHSDVSKYAWQNQDNNDGFIVARVNSTYGSAFEWTIGIMTNEGKAVSAAEYMEEYMHDGIPREVVAEVEQDIATIEKLTADRHWFYSDEAIQEAANLYLER